MNLIELKNKKYFFQTNSKDIKKDDVFIALKGEKNDGHNYLNDAFQRGASFAVVEKDIPFKNILKVDNVLIHILKETSKLVNNNSKLKIGITGSTGKTTTKECLHQILSNTLSIFSTHENYNTEIGIPLSILNYYNNEDVAILEMGLQKKDDLKFLSNFYDLDVAFITNIGTSHIEFLESKENIAYQKSLITKNMKKGLVVLNGDYEKLLDFIPKNLNIIKFGKKDSNDSVLKDFEYSENKTKVLYKIFGKDVFLTLNNIWSEGQLIDLLAVISFCIFIQIPIDPYFISNIELPSSRFEIIKTDNCTIINDSYNASFESFKSGFESIKKYTSKDKKILIMSEIKESGEYSKEIHIKTIKLAQNIFNEIYFLDPENKFNYLNNINFIKNIEEVKELINNTKGIIYIKGSNSTGLYKFMKERSYL
ncbi:MULTISPECIES: UDP-N-acetylmuramoyl-tripeptide--D-alanyl-D-alanine ligase [Oceanotoga]|jgi:UDP-N-acetylmuramoyl-tripeptide--D-alanyl-D-alanine ligase|uniref:UDP-N-acetylmuramoyl-tripeptide--D-alanyl-D-alanine ligase n=1 Tax=Oceanotoga teriensis TaxID=515440 RepID=A0AA45C7P3_9BACT|nr:MULTISPECIES: UDP-N-acetylmuramoyl-tripeptide--D-alanyl-D-alanine ligase [Oceanotoga]MDN5342123.1 UDP-N-acetylmuramoyl-tripeptide--D-alanyl-D-alanine ligase [Oceanotoga sp.]MDO7976249.1 UDP-N-acetylmuramoyl-tripeptide--D-alanyl-D-alanine ligase [Oceanotoga teriensis]PWJ95446.1 UDP-N-acetylmuramoyl-tripeptide--D-alanyl-D-alanine ligase [Oceanotoga teriensis]